MRLGKNSNFLCRFTCHKAFLVAFRLLKRKASQCRTGLFFHLQLLSITEWKNLQYIQIITILKSERQKGNKIIPRIVQEQVVMVQKAQLQNQFLFRKFCILTMNMQTVRVEKTTCCKNCGHGIKLLMTCTIKFVGKLYRKS